MRDPLLLSSLRKEVSKSDLSESDSLLQKLDSTIQKVEAAAGVINELQDSAERLIISREETVVRATVRRKPGVAMRRERIYRSNDHNFVSHFFNQPTFCAHCTDFIWGLGNWSPILAIVHPADVGGQRFPDSVWIYCAMSGSQNLKFLVRRVFECPDFELELDFDRQTTHSNSGQNPDSAVRRRLLVTLT